jgi:hypothetical protein
MTTKKLKRKERLNIAADVLAMSTTIIGKLIVQTKQKHISNIEEDIIKFTQEIVNKYQCQQ